MSESARSKFNSAVILMVVGAFLSLQAWTLKEVVGLKVQVAELNTKVTDHVSHEIARK